MDWTPIILLAIFVGIVGLGCAGFLFNQNTLAEISSENRRDDDTTPR